MVLYLIVDSNGEVRDIHVYQTVGREVDTRVVHTVRQWKFRAGQRNGPEALQQFAAVSVRLASCGSTKVALRSRSVTPISSAASFCAINFFLAFLNRTMPRGHFYSAQIGHSHFAALTKVTIQAYDRLTYCGTIYVFSRSFLPAALVFGQIGTRCPVPHQSLQPGPYRISFEATGFRRLIREKCRAKFHAMLRTGRADQRRALRYPFSGEVKAHQLPLHGRSKGHKGPIRGKA